MELLIYPIIFYVAKSATLRPSGGGKDIIACINIPPFSP